MENEDCSCNCLPTNLKRATVIIYLYGMFVHFLPSEPYFVPFLMSSYHNLTEEAVVGEVLPVWTYSYLAFLIPVFLLTDVLRYKPIIVCQGIGWIVCYTCLIFGNGVPLMQLVEVFYALGTAAEVAYNSYIYSVVAKEDYQKYTANIRSVILFSSSVSSILAQLLVSLLHINYVYLNCISAACVTVATFLALLLPTPRHTVYFYTRGSPSPPSVDPAYDEKHVTAFSSHNYLDETPIQPSEDEETRRRTWSAVAGHMWNSAKLAYTDRRVLVWSIWWALSFCGWISVVNYIQSLWDVLDAQSNWNGFVFLLANVFGSIGAFSVRWCPKSSEKWHALLIGIASLLICLSIVLIHVIPSIYCSYVSYILFILFYNFVATVTQYQLAVRLSADIFALILGTNTFFAMVLNTIMTVVLVDDAGLGLPVATQFIIYGSYFGAIAFAYIIYGFFAK